MLSTLLVVGVISHLWCAAHLVSIAHHSFYSVGEENTTEEDSVNGVFISIFMSCNIALALLELSLVSELFSAIGNSTYIFFFIYNTFCPIREVLYHFVHLNHF